MKKFLTILFSLSLLTNFVSSQSIGISGGEKTALLEVADAAARTALTPSVAKGRVVKQISDNTVWLQKPDGTWSQLPSGTSYTAGNGVSITGSSIAAKIDPASTNLTNSASGLKFSPEETWDGYDVFIVAGQSNTCSGNIGFDPAVDIFPEMNKIVQLNRSAPGTSTVATPNVIPLTEPAKHFALPNTGTGHLPWNQNWVGYDRYFAKEYIQKGKLYGNRKVLFIMAGHPGSSFIANNWKVGDPSYASMVTLTNWVKSNLSGVKIKGMIWHQGEADTGNPNYQTQLDTMFTSFRTAVNEPNLPIVLGGFVPMIMQNTAWHTTSEIVRATPRRIPYAAYADPERPTWLTPDPVTSTGDNIHFDVVEDRQLGVRYYNAWLKAVSNGANVPDNVQLITARPLPDGTASVRFPDPYENRAALTTWEMRHWSGAAPANNAVPTVTTFTNNGQSSVDSQRELIASALTAGVNTFQVRVQNAMGWSDWSAPAQCTTATVADPLAGSTLFLLRGESFKNFGSIAGTLNNGRSQAIVTTDRGGAYQCKQVCSTLWSGYTPALTQAMSLSAWIRIDAAQMNPNFPFHSNQHWLTDSNHLRVFVWSGNLWVGVNSTLVNTGALAAGTWTHIYVDYNGATTMTYSRNNAAATTQVVVAPTSSAEVRFMANTGGGSFLGFARQIRLHNRVLTVAERTTLFGMQ